LAHKATAKKEIKTSMPLTVLWAKRIVYSLFWPGTPTAGDRLESKRWKQLRLPHLARLFFDMK
jgi:hypothetical protein